MMKRFTARFMAVTSILACLFFVSAPQLVAQQPSGGLTRDKTGLLINAGSATGFNVGSGQTIQFLAGSIFQWNTAAVFSGDAAAFRTAIGVGPTLPGINSISSVSGNDLVLAATGTNQNVIVNPIGTGTFIIDHGTGSLPATISATTIARIVNADTLATRLEFESYGSGNGGFIDSRLTGGTRASPSSPTTVGAQIIGMAAYGYTSALTTTANGSYKITIGSAWSTSNAETKHLWAGTPSGSTSLTNWMQLDGLNGLSVLNALPFTSTGKLNISGAAVVSPSGGSNYHVMSSTVSGDPGGTSDIRGILQQVSVTGSNNIAFVNANYLAAINSMTSGTLAGQGAATLYTSVAGAGNTTGGFGAAAFLVFTSTGNMTSSYEGIAIDPPTYSSTGRLTGTMTGFSIANDLGVSNAFSGMNGFYISDQTASASGNTVGFRTTMSSGTNKWGMRLEGTAPNYLGGATTFGAAVADNVTTLTYASPTTVTVTNGNVFKTTTINATGSVTFNASAGGTAGQHMWIVITNDATSGKTITFGTNFKPSATLVGVISKSSTVEFVSDGTSWWETGRVVGTL